MFQRFRAELVATFASGIPETPAWVPELEKGTNGGYFAPGSVVWKVHGATTAVVAGVRALLMQALHPGVLAGVWDHSSFREDPLGRLGGTIRWIFTLTYGDTHAAKAASDWVIRIHEGVTGTFTDGHGVERSYRAGDQDLLRWVHIAFMDAFLTANQRYGTPVDADDYVRGWSIAGELMGVRGAPVTESQLRADLQKSLEAGELRCDSRTEEVVSFLRNPPLPKSQRRGYRVIFAAAVDSLEPEFRELLQLHQSRFPAATRLVTRLILALIRWGLGKDKPSESAALRRRARLGLDAQ